jgi:hypothetical protein
MCIKGLWSLSDRTRVRTGCRVAAPTRRGHSCSSIRQRKCMQNRFPCRRGRRRRSPQMQGKVTTRLTRNKRARRTQR